MMTIKQFLLLKLSEECSEVSQRALKQMQFGRDEIQKSQDKTNGERLREEVNHLIAVITILLEIGEMPSITPEELLDAIDVKRFRVNKYLRYSQELGMVENNGK